MVREKIQEIADNIDKFKRKGDSFFYKKIKIEISEFFLYNKKVQIGGIIVKINGHRINLENDEEINVINNALQKEHDKLLQEKKNKENELLNSIRF